MHTNDLRALLDAALADDRPHVEKLAVAAAVISEVLRQQGMQATLVGGGAIELHAPGVYATSDIDLVVEGRSRADLDAALTGFGLTRRGRHWVLGDLFVEVPGNHMSDPVDVVTVGSLPLRVVRREIVLADRIVGFKHWRATAYGIQAIALLDALADALDETVLRRKLEQEDAVDAFEALRVMARESRGTPVTDEALRKVLERLHASSKGES